MQKQQHLEQSKAGKPIGNNIQDSAIPKDQLSRQGTSKSSQGHISNQPKFTIRTDRDEYYQEEVIYGSVRLKFDRHFKDFVTRLAFVYEENYVLFDEKTEQAIVTKEHKKILDQQELVQRELYEPGEHYFQFGIQLPSLISASTFYHSGKSLSAKISYKIQIKITEKAAQGQSEDKVKVYKDELFVKVNRHCKYVTIKKLVHNESTINKFLCFGGGRTSIQCEYARDTFCVDADRLQLILSNQNNQSVLSYQSNREDIGTENPTMIEMRLTVNNHHNNFKVDEVVVQLIQVIAIKEDDHGRKEKKTIKHIQEQIYVQNQPGILPKDHTVHPRLVKIDLMKVHKLVQKRQQAEGFYGDLSKIELTHSKGIQQSSEGEYIDNFYILRVRAMVNKDIVSSPYIDQQIFFCYHEVPNFEMDESQMKNIAEMHRNYVHENFERGEISHLDTRLHSVGFHATHHQDHHGGNEDGDNQV
eukprot:403340939